MSDILSLIPVFFYRKTPSDSLTSLYLTEKLKYIFILSVLIGMTTAAAGYFLSFVFSMPTGASIVLTGSVIFILGLLKSRFASINKNVFT